MKRLLIAALLLAGSADAEVEIPKCVDPRVKISLIAEHPDIMTPTGVAVDRSGRIFVLENHTHFRPEDYDGPPADRILIFDQKGNRSVFHEGLTFGTDLLFDRVGGLYASTRASVVYFNQLSIAREGKRVPAQVIDLETSGNYPHNGVSGLALDSFGRLHFGFGENLGEPYTFVGSDGVRISGGGEGGSAYRCSASGEKLERIATGFWNPFGMTFDAAGNLFAVGNDPGSSPPCRLLHVVDGADFGYEFRYGRSGLHPLVTWNGKFPGTVPMAGGTGEAPCGVIPLGKDLLVASWADHRIDLHRMAANGASFTAEREGFIQGGNEFRPVHFAWGPDGRTLYVTDWVSSSYQLHKQGRLWMVEFPEEMTKKKYLPVTAEARLAMWLRDGGGSMDECIDALTSDDPFIRSAAIRGLWQYRDKLSHFAWSESESARLRANFVTALRRQVGRETEGQLLKVLADDSPDVRFVGIKWIADERLDGFRSDLEGLLEAPDLERGEFLAVMAALDRLDETKKVRDVPDPEKLLGVLANAGLSPRLRSLALRLIPANNKQLSLKRLSALFSENVEAFGVEVVRTVQHHPAPGRGGFLLQVARDSLLEPGLRMEAIVGLAALADEYREELAELSKSADEKVAEEAARALTGLEGIPMDPERLEAKPPMHDVDAWLKWVGEDLSGADPEAGRRIFFHPKLGTCYRCHQMRGRGVRVGPDLTAIHERADARWLLETVLLPNVEISPQFLPWSIETTDGKTHVGLPMRKGGKAEAYLGVDGKEFTLRKGEIVRHEEMQVSLMPAGLLNPMTRGEIRNLLAFLLEKRK